MLIQYSAKNISLTKSSLLAFFHSFIVVTNSFILYQKVGVHAIGEAYRSFVQVAVIKISK